MAASSVSIFKWWNVFRFKIILCVASFLGRRNIGDTNSPSSWAEITITHLSRSFCTSVLPVFKLKVCHWCSPTSAWGWLLINSIVTRVTHSKIELSHVNCCHAGRKVTSLPAKNLGWLVDILTTPAGIAWMHVCLLTSIAFEHWAVLLPAICSGCPFSLVQGSGLCRKKDFSRADMAGILADSDYFGYMKNKVVFGAMRSDQSQKWQLASLSWPTCWHPIFLNFDSPGQTSRHQRAC